MASATPTKHEFIAILPDHDGVLEKRLRVRQNHLDALAPKIEAGFWRFGGAMLRTPFLPDQTPTSSPSPQIHGSVLLALAESEEEVWRQLREDVYAREGVWDLDKAQVWPFKTGVKNL